MKRPFWMHQLVEYLLGVALLSQGLRTTEPLVPTVLGALVLLNVAVVDGPLSAFKAVSRGFHRGVDVALVPGMVFHVPITLREYAQWTVAVSETVLVTPDGGRRLSTLPAGLLER